MHKNDELIQKLTLEQKIEIVLTKNLWRDTVMNELNIYDLSAVNDFFMHHESVSPFNTTLSPSSVAYSWNLELVQLAANEMVKEVYNKKSNIILTPFINTNTDNEIYNISEEIHLTKEILKSYVATFHQQNVFVMGKYLDEGLMNQSNQTRIYETLDMIKNSNIDGIIIYNNSTFASALQNEFNYDGLILIHSTDENNQTVYSLYSNMTSKHDNKSDLENVVLRYKEYNKKFEEDTINAFDFNNAKDNHFIIDEKQLDKQVLNILEFINNLCGSILLENDKKLVDELPLEKEKMSIIDQSKKELIVRAVEESIVLLKNENDLLPISPHSRVVLIGNFDLLIDDKTEQAKMLNMISKYLPNHLGLYKEYDSFSENDNQLFNDTLEKTKDADIVIIKMYLNEKQFNLSSSQISCISKWHEAGKKVIVVLPSFIRGIETEWEQKCSAIFTGQVLDSLSMNALINIVVGNTAPSGKLVHAMYIYDSNTQSNSDAISYPFGFGLSYTSFHYSNLTIDQNGVKFSLTNTGQVDGNEIIQLYIIGDSAADVNGKQLVGFHKVFLKARESKTIEMQFGDDAFQFYSIDSHEWENRMGRFTIEIASSKNKVELHSTINNHISQEIKKELNNSNISAFYHHFDDRESKKPNWTLRIVILLTIYFDLSFIIASRFMTHPDYYVTFLIFIVVINILAFNIVRDIIKVEAKKPKKRENVKIHILDDIESLEATNVHVYITDEPIVKPEPIIEPESIVEPEPFVDEAYHPEIIPLDNGIVENETAITILKPKEIIEQEAIFTEELDMGNYCGSLCQYMADNGLKIEKRVAREIFSSMAASRIIILKHIEPKLSERFLEIFSDFIGANYFMDDFNHEANSFADFFQVECDIQLEKCIESADKKSDLIHIMAFNDVDLSTSDKSLSKLIEYATNPLLSCSIDEVPHIGISELPKNIWFVIIPMDFDKTTMSSALLQCSITLDMDAKAVMPKDIVYKNALGLSYHYFMNNLRDSRELYYINEDLWKKIDQLEYYVNERVSFVIDNRVFRQLERYTTMYVLCDGDHNEAIDSVLSTKLLMMITKLTVTKKDETDEGIFALCEKLFGLENLTKSKTLLKYIEEV